MTDITKYLEIDSSFRDRNQYPSPGEFTVPVQTSGMKDKANAIDPVALSAPTIDPFNSIFDTTLNTVSIAGTVASTIAVPVVNSGNGTSPKRVIVFFNTTGAIPIADYYAGAVLIITTSGGDIYRQRITGYTFVQDSANGTGIFDVDASFSADALVDGNDVVIVNSSFSGAGDESTVFIPTGSIFNNFYINYYITDFTTGKTGRVLFYDGALKLAIVNINFDGSVPWAISHYFILRKELPNEVGQFSAGSTASAVVLSSSASSIDNHYRGDFIRIISGALTFEIRRITRYIVDGGVKTATVYPPFSSAPVVNVYYEILPFSYDNYTPLLYSGSEVSAQQTVCYDIQLLNIVIPNLTLNVGHGKRMPFYPYMYVQLENSTNSNGGTNNALVSVNPNSTKMLFRATIDDTNNPETSNYLTFDGDNMTQTVSFRVNDTLHFSARLYTGEIYNTAIPEDYSPRPPNPDIQISAVFSLTRKN